MPQAEDLQPTEADLQLRAEVEREDKYNLFEKAQSKRKHCSFPPIKGLVTQKFSSENKHFAVDVAATKNTPIKAILNGTIVFADWTPSSKPKYLSSFRPSIRQKHHDYGECGRKARGRQTPQSRIGKSKYTKSRIWHKGTLLGTPALKNIFYLNVFVSLPSSIIFDPLSAKRSAAIPPY